MQTITLLLLALSFAPALSIPQGHVHTETTTAVTASPTVSLLPGQATAIPPDFIVAEKIGTEPKTPGGQVIKLRQGPFRVNGESEKNVMQTATLPCKDCFITQIETTLEYEDGTEANVNTGAWLHHMVMSKRAEGAFDLVCKDSWWFSRGSERVFSSGNERVSRRFNDYYKLGMKIDANETLSYVVEIMNESHEAKDYWIVMSYEYVQGPAAEGYGEVTLLYLDPTGCIGSGAVPAQYGEYEVRTVPYNSTVNGRFIWAQGHVHDGGVKTVLYRNGEAICESVHLYGRTPQFLEPPTSHSPDTLHISDTGVCKDFGKISVGDEIVAVSYYNATLYPPQVHHDGNTHAVMGNCHVYIQVDEE